MPASPRAPPVLFRGQPSGDRGPRRHSRRRQFHWGQFLYRRPCSPIRWRWRRRATSTGHWRYWGPAIPAFMAGPTTAQLPAAYCTPAPAPVPGSQLGAGLGQSPLAGLLRHQQRPDDRERDFGGADHHGRGHGRLAPPAVDPRADRYQHAGKRVRPGRRRAGRDDRPLCQRPCRLEHGDQRPRHHRQLQQRRLLADRLLLGRVRVRGRQRRHRAHRPGLEANTVLNFPNATSVKLSSAGPSSTSWPPTRTSSSATATYSASSMPTR